MRLTPASALGMAAHLLCGAAPASPPPEAQALVVGLNTSQDQGVAPLRFADDDAARYFELFVSAGIPVELLALLDADTQSIHPEATRAAKPPSRAEIDAAVRRIAEKLKAAGADGRHTELYFVYVGHGSRTPEGEGYVNLIDGILTRRDLFHAVLNPIPATYKHVIVDACNAHHLVTRRGQATAEELKTLKALLDGEVLEGHPEVGVLVAGNRDAETHEWSVLRGGVFSHEVRSALLGAADADGDGLVRYSEVAAFVASANAGLSDPRARAELWAHPPALNMAHPLMDLRRGERRFLEVPSAMGGRVRVDDARGLRFAEFNASGEAPVYIRLAGRGDYFVVRDDREARVPDAAAPIARLSPSGFGPVRTQARGPVEDDLRRGLFSVAYGPGFLRGFISRSGSLGTLPAAGDPFPGPALGRMEVMAERRGSRARTAGWVVIGLGAALGAGSTFAAIKTRAGYDGLLDRVATQGTYDADQVRSIENWRLATNLMLAGSITSGVSGLALVWSGGDGQSGQIAVGAGPGLRLALEY